MLLTVSCLDVMGFATGYIILRVGGILFIFCKLGY